MAEFSADEFEGACTRISIFLYHRYRSVRFFSRKIISVVSFSAMFFTGKLTRKFGSDKNFEKSQVGEARIRRNTCHNEVLLSSAFGYGASAAVRRRCCSHSRPYARCNERERDKERKVDRPSDFQFGLHELETVCA